MVLKGVVHGLNVKVGEYKGMSSRGAGTLCFGLVVLGGGV